MVAMNMSSLPSFSTEDGVLDYIKKIKVFPILSSETEIELANKWVALGDVKAAHQLVTSHLRLVVKIAFGFKGYGLPIMDLISEGNIGLMQAVKRFDPTKGFRLSTYAMCWIKAKIHDYIYDSLSSLKIGAGAAKKKLFFSLRKMKEKLFRNNEGRCGSNLTNEDVEAISKELSVTKEQVIDMDNYFSSVTKSVSLNDHVSGGDANTKGELQDFIANENHEEQEYEEREHLDYRRKLLYKGLKKLNDREQDILISRKLSSPAVGLSALASKYKVSLERIRQLEQQAMQRIKTYVDDCKDECENKCHDKHKVA